MSVGGRGCWGVACWTQRLACGALWNRPLVLFVLVVWRLAFHVRRWMLQFGAELQILIAGRWFSVRGGRIRYLALVLFAQCLVFAGGCWACCGGR